MMVNTCLVDTRRCIGIANVKIGSYQLNGVKEFIILEETLSKSVKKASRAKDVNLSKFATKAYIL